MKVTTAFGDSYEARQVCVRMTKTLGVEVYLADLNQFVGGEVSEEQLKEIAHEAWLEAWELILKLMAKRFLYIDLELLSTDHVEVEVVE